MSDIQPDTKPLVTNGLIIKAVIFSDYSNFETKEKTGDDYCLLFDDGRLYFDNFDNVKNRLSAKDIAEAVSQPRIFYVNEMHFYDKNNFSSKLRRKNFLYRTWSHNGRLKVLHIEEENHE